MLPLSAEVRNWLLTTHIPLRL